MATVVAQQQQRSNTVVATLATVATASAVLTCPAIEMPKNEGLQHGSCCVVHQVLFVSVGHSVGVGETVATVIEVHGLYE